MGIGPGLTLHEPTPYGVKNTVLGSQTLTETVLALIFCRHDIRALVRLTQLSRQAAHHYELRTWETMTQLLACARLEC